MTRELKRLGKEISMLSGSENIVSVVVYGSIIGGIETAKDFDVVIIVKKIKQDLEKLFELFLRRKKNLDFNIYTLKEIQSKLSYFTREYKLEYLAKGECIFGKNIFIEEFKKVREFEYKQSILIRSIEHLQMTRQKYFSSLFDHDQKLKYLEKYFFRISKNLLLFRGLENHSSVNKLSRKNLFQRLYDAEILDVELSPRNAFSAEDYLFLFNKISDVLIQYKKDFFGTICEK